MENKVLNLQLIEYRSVLKSLAYKFTNDPEDIQDLVQETLLRALKYVDQFFHNPRVVSWLFVIMKNIYINNYRNRKHRYLYEHNTASSYQDLGCREPFTENTVENNLALKDVQKALTKLPKEYKEMFDYHVEGYKYKELAQHYGIPEGTIKSRIFLIRKSLQKQFPQYR
ncbi:RNA polymerase sigma factor [Sphingobacterium yanglingense]|uniref:RNA polymerase sigma factor n=1 Tax=Sphingobacterium yanglingense TaxID=1437280 RepID=A0A4R6WIF1_9SPHI|nr:RNA polymerase sigma factor [Sphingobacterium yanglingense]TDQ80013.1 RNA polymerase sigma-70 factor (ECF subfamily) [Sphingobacterium yanglingense]